MSKKQKKLTMNSENVAMTPTLGGQIVRVYMENFMTYDSAEIRPGFHLNMIIGPNGTGKSTIVCAVLLGLGGKLKTLGRADQLSSYVKSNCDQSLIETELYNPGGENIVIRRMISSSNQSQFYINGKTASASQVTEIREKFHIQVDNLCTFLPQEKVQDFAKMNSQQLLEHTERTIGSGELLQRHEALRALRSELDSYQNQKHAQEDQLVTEQTKNERLQVKVQAIKEKQMLSEKVELLNQKKHWLKYHEIVKQVKEVEKDQSLANSNIAKKRTELEQAQKELKAIENGSKTQQERLATAKNEESGKRAVVEDRFERLHHRLDKFADLGTTLKSKLADEQRKKKELANCQATVEKLTNDLNAIENSADTGLKEEEKKINQQLNKRHEDEVNLSNKIMSVEEDSKYLKQELRNVVSEKRLLENRQNVRLDYLQKNEADVYKATMWLDQNQHLFQGKVYKPMLLELNVTDTNMARVVETTIPFQDLLAFTVTYGDDLNTLVQNLRVKMKLKVNIVSSESGQSTQYQPNTPISRLAVFGFHAYVKDFIVGPDPILQYLCRSYRIHNIPVGNASVQSHTDKIPSNIKRFFSEEYVFDVRTSTYSGAKSTTVKRLTAARFFTESTDTSKIQQLERKESELSKKMEKHNAQMSEMEREKTRLQEAMQELRRKRREIAMRLEERQRVTSDLERAKAQYTRIKGTLRKPEELKNDQAAEKQALETALERMMNDLMKAHKALEDAYLKRTKAALALRASRIGIEVIQDRISQAQNGVRNAEDAKRLTDDKLRNLESSADRARAAAKNLTNGCGPGDKGFRQFQLSFKDISDKINELEAELEETKARADFLDGGSAQVLREYTKREEEIAKLKSDHEKMGAEITNKLAQIEKNRELWLVPIQELLATIDKSFGNHFASMGCAGEVCLQEPEDPNDFDSYGVKIRVTFRDGVPLQDLGRHFQSGGERAVSTAIYMLSLQNLTSVPFRFVDEINQGMDPANERRITDLIIRVTTPRDSSQYFFVTPKLLADLKCPETMSVLCVHNGKAALSSADWDLDKFLRRSQGQEDYDESI